jgi:hypothetical protein
MQTVNAHKDWFNWDIVEKVSCFAICLYILQYSDTTLQHLYNIYVTILWLPIVCVIHMSVLYALNLCGHVHFQTWAFIFFNNL